MSHGEWRRLLLSACSSCSLPLFPSACQRSGRRRRLTPRARSLALILDAARASRPALRAAREALSAASARARQARALSNPVLAYGREQTSGGGQTNSQDISQLEQAVEFGERRAARGSAAGARVEIAAARLRLAERDLVFEATRADARSTAWPSGATVRAFHAW